LFATILELKKSGFWDIFVSMGHFEISRFLGSNKDTELIYTPKCLLWVPLQLLYESKKFECNVNLSFFNFKILNEIFEKKEI
jgi:hypothetical protein